MLKGAVYGCFFCLGACILIIALEVSTKSVSASFNFIRPYFIEHGGEACLKTLTNRGVTFSALKNAGSKQCPVYNAVRVTSFSQTKISGPLMLTCPTALAIDKWLVLAEASFVKHLGSYNCRKARNSRVASEHSYGTAIDIAAIDGASVLKDWGKHNEKGKKLQVAYSEACKIFYNSLGPEYNTLHKDHFHLDLGFGAGCWVNDKVSKIIKLAR